jgi:integrase
MSRGTRVLDRMCGHLGRLRLATGTHDKREAAAFNGLVTDLIKRCEWDTLTRLRDHALTIRQVYYARLRGEPLPAPEDTSPVWPIVARWLTHLDATANTKDTYQGLLDRLARAYPDATVARLASVLEQDKQVHQAKGTRSTFNDRRRLCLQFLRSHVGARHDTYFAVQAVAPFSRKQVKRRSGNPQTPDQIRALVARIPSQAANIWGMCLTGMRQAEWFAADWTLMTDRVVIPGTKTDNAMRLVPRLYPLARPFGTYSRHVQILARHTHGDVQPHDFRRTFMCWMEDAGIPRTRRQVYLGHAVQGVTELYERRRSVEPWLTQDAEKMRTFLGENPLPLTLQVMA